MTLSTRVDTSSGQMEAASGELPRAVRSRRNARHSIPGLSARGFPAPRHPNVHAFQVTGAPARDGSAKTGGGPLQMVTNGRLG